MSHNTIGNIGCETLLGFMKRNKSLKYLDISFNEIGDRGLLAVAECLVDNDKMEVLNLLGNEFTDKSIKFLTESLGKAKNSKLSILKIGNMQSEASIFEQFLTVGFDNSPVLKYLYVTTNQFAHPMVNKIHENEGDNPKTLVVTEKYDPKLDSHMVVDLIGEMVELNLFGATDMQPLYAFGEKIINDIIKDKFGVSNLEVLVYVFAYIFPPDHILSNNLSPMHLFAKFGCLEPMFYCLRLKVSPNYKTSISYQEYPAATSLHIAAGYSQLEMCKFLMTSSLTDINCRDLHGNTPFHYAGVAGSSQLATLMATGGASALQVNKKKMLPLHSCVFSDHTVAFNIILKETERQKTKAFAG